MDVISRDGREGGRESHHLGSTFGCLHVLNLQDSVTFSLEILLILSRDVGLSLAIATLKEAATCCPETRIGGGGAHVVFRSRRHGLRKVVRWRRGCAGDGGRLFAVLTGGVAGGTAIGEHVDLDRRGRERHCVEVLVAGNDADV